jgi:S1-C subfamily serine protease
VSAGKLAQQAGIVVGDIITHCDRQPITNPNEMAAALTAIANDAQPIVTYSRLHPEGYFTSATIAIEGKPLI